MPVALKALSHHTSFEGGKQRCRSIPFVVVGHRSTAPLLHRQSRLRAIQRPNLALFSSSPDSFDV